MTDDMTGGYMERLLEVEASLSSDTGQTAFSSLLKSCPFCGKDRAWLQTWGGSYVEARVVCGSCHVATSIVGAVGTVHEPTGRDVTRLMAMEQAISSWNRRAERTCRIVEDVDEVETELGPIEVRTYLCGECHGRMAPDDAYCPNCGAKVVSE